VKPRASRKGPVNRRSFLRGAAGVSLALPFLESIPERSAWAEGEKPIFSLFLGAVEGVIPRLFFPDELGPLTRDGLAAARKATSALSAHAENLLFLKNIDWPLGSPTGEAHAQGLTMILTGRVPYGSTASCTSTGPSADVVIANAAHPGKDPLTLYAGNANNAYIEERLSFASAGALRAAVDNPYTLYQEIVGMALPGGGMTPDGEQAARLLLESRQSVHDLVREELTALMNDSRMSAADRQRLELHFDSIRDMEVNMGGAGGGAASKCSSTGLDLAKLESLSDYKWRADGTTEENVKLFMQLVAVAFACNYRRSATIQWGDAYDGTIYPVPSNAELGNWKFSHVSHGAQSDSSVGDNALAQQVHAEIDALRMQTLATGLDAFAARGLVDQSFVMWTLNYADGMSHSFRNVPHIIWGNAGGYLKTGEYLDVGPITNNTLLTTLISAALQDAGESVEDFGDASGQLDAIRA
jgi:hypothetical protein